MIEKPASECPARLFYRSGHSASSNDSFAATALQLALRKNYYP
jgi:hypothetical protein